MVVAERIEGKWPVYYLVVVILCSIKYGNKEQVLERDFQLNININAAKNREITVFGFLLLCFCFLKIVAFPLLLQ